MTIFFLIFFLVSCSSVMSRKIESSSSLSCGDFHNIRCPFTLKGNPSNCKRPIELACVNNRTTLYLSQKSFYVLDIVYIASNWIRIRIRIVDPGLQKDNCSSMPRYSLSSEYFSLASYRYFLRSSSKLIFYMKCSTPVDSPYYVDTSPCINASSNMYSYVVSEPATFSELKNSCNIYWISAAAMGDGGIYHSYYDVHSEMLKGFDIYWDGPTGWLRILVLWMEVLTTYLLVLLAGRFVLGTPFVVALVIYTLRRRHRAMDPGVEAYLHDYGNQMPLRYSYNDVKRMTKNFKEKLGQGGYGSVFKGVLSSKRLVAVKIMATSKGNGQEFINEVASIGRIHHVNVVRLVGFVAERSKRALIYEYMPNGSLEKYIFPREENLINPLSWEKVYEIAVGVARGMDYLHRGCEMQILHFDIKPHNILLDKNFIPKISDFGLAKLYPTDNSIVSVTAARGTMGYIAPELVYRNIGGVSYKSDVYSYGMLLLEMAGRRKNVNPFVENSSQIYFPSWIYDQLNRGKDIEMEGITGEEEQELGKKMIIVGLWCIQLKPMDRPSMTKVVQMLEGNLDLLQMPPKPSLLPEQDGMQIP